MTILIVLETYTVTGNVRDGIFLQRFGTAQQVFNYRWACLGPIMPMNALWCDIRRRLYK